MNDTLTISILVLFIFVFVLVSYLSKRGENKTSTSSSEDYIIGGRNIGTIVLVLSMGATYFSTWTLLGAFGSYYRSGVWFVGFTVWAIFHAIFIWLFGVRIWMAGKKFGFITPGQMIKHYYKSNRLKMAVAVVGIAALVPVMLIQVVGGARALTALTDGTIPYVVGVTVTSVMVGVIVLWAGFKGTAWTDSFMGIFFAAVLIFAAFYVLSLAGGGSVVFERIAEYKPELVINSGNPLGMLELWLGLGFGAWVLPHMWQKFYSASSVEVLGKVAMATPFWNSWMMAIIPLIIGMAAVIPGVAPGLDTSTSDTILPLIFNAHLPVFSAFVVAGILAAAISTINSQLLSAASLVAEDVVGTLTTEKMTSSRVTWVTRVVVVVLTFTVFILALLPSASGFLVPIASLGFGLGLQLVPSSLGMLYFKWITEAGAFSGLIAGTTVMGAFAIFSHGMPVGPSIAGIVVNILVTIIVSKFTAPVPNSSIEDFHGMYSEYISDDAIVNNNEVQKT